jgi:hypothetical protein
MTDDLTKRIADLERELRELKAQLPPPPVEEKKPRQPWPKYDPTEGFRMPASAVKAMVDVVPDMRGIAQEQKQVSVPGGFGAPAKSGGEAAVRGSGWQDPGKLEPPSGIKHVDAIAQHFATLDKLETVKKIADAIKAGGAEK